MPSDLSKPPRRIPQQQRGERRVVDLLEASSAVIAEVGYDAATMTQIAERAGASIGALYQYFPNKEAIVIALRTQYGDEMETHLTPLTQQAHTLSIPQWVDRIFEVLVAFMDSRPAYMALLSVPTKFKRDPVARNRLREHFSTHYRKKQPKLTPEDAFRIANVTLQIVKGMNPLYAEAKPKERQKLVQEFKQALTAYLESRLA
ncbi:TetR/AcrR family transcriptional regulator [Granulicella sp. dw_53]|uniref:TetR/AcrR family transcriptional regulator n=1 Tax=Granulicella sp. dw_53 TaxID=2719792 RepID=UPI001BD32C4B|nr:TetR/AcrR family transcriptional regulator [Granulicella sp. dw_53]